MWTKVLFRGMTAGGLSSMIWTFFFPSLKVRTLRTKFNLKKIIDINVHITENWRYYSVLLNHAELIMIWVIEWYDKDFFSNKSKPPTTFDILNPCFTIHMRHAPRPKKQNIKDAAGCKVSINMFSDKWGVTIVTIVNTRDNPV